MAAAVGLQARQEQRTDRYAVPCCTAAPCSAHRLYIATGQEQYKKAAFDYYMKHYKEEDGPGVWDNFDWDSHSWAAVVLLQRWVFVCAS
jgi:hypothetical protein